MAAHSLAIQDTLTAIAPHRHDCPACRGWWWHNFANCDKPADAATCPPCRIVAAGGQPAPRVEATILAAAARALTREQYTDPGRIARGARLVADGAVRPLEQVGSYAVRSTCNYRDYEYIVRGRLTCTCPDHTQRATVCKHIVATTLYVMVVDELAWLRATATTVRCPRCRISSASPLDARAIQSDGECSQCIAADRQEVA